MNISIEYCTQWGYLDRALSLREELENEFKVTLIKGTGGVFEIVVNEHLQVFSKKELNRFPNSSYEVIKTIRDAVDERRLG